MNFRILILLILIPLSLILIFTSSSSERKPLIGSKNRIAFGIDAGQETVDIEINMPSSLNFLSRNEILGNRKSYVSNYNFLLKEAYEPGAVITDGIDDGLPWWGLKGLYYHDMKVDLEERKIDGLSARSIFLNNPFLLLAADCYYNYNPRIRKEIPEVPEHLFTASGFPFQFCTPTKLTYHPNNREVHVEYDFFTRVRSLLAAGYDKFKITGRRFFLQTVNARDFGFQYYAIDYTRSKGIDLKAKNPEGVVPMSHYYVTGNSCSYPGGCNNMGSSIEDPYVHLSELPATVVVKMWLQKPESPESDADVSYFLHFPDSSTTAE